MTILRSPDIVASPDLAPQPARRPWVLAAFLLALVAGAYAAATIALGLHLPLGRDEVVYASQVARSHYPAYFSAPRARGVTWLVAPLLQVTDSTQALRAYVGILSGVGLLLGSWPWLRVRGLTSPLVVPTAAMLFATMWLSLFYGSAVMPNLWVAFGALAATAFLLRSGQGSAHPRLEGLGVAASVGVVTLIRPTDGAVLICLVSVATIALLRVQALPLILGTAAAFGLAFIPWAMEAEDHFGGVTARLRDASGTEGGFLNATSAMVQLRVIDGPLLCRPTCRAGQVPPPVDGLIWITVWAVLAVLAALFAVRRGRASAALVPIAMGVGLAVPYVFAVGYAAPRFLQPAYALFSFAVAEGAFAVGASARTLRAAWAALITAGLCAFAVNQAALAEGIVSHHIRSRGRQAVVAEELRSAGLRPGCMISGSAAPVLAYALRCESSALTGHDASITRQELAIIARHRQVVLLRPAGTTLVPPDWAQGELQDGYPVPSGGGNRLWNVFLPMSLAPRSTARQPR